MARGADTTMQGIVTQVLVRPRVAYLHLDSGNCVVVFASSRLYGVAKLVPEGSRIRATGRVDRKQKGSRTYEDLLAYTIEVTSVEPSVNAPLSAHRDGSSNKRPDKLVSGIGGLR